MTTASMQIPEATARRIRLIVLDVDGVMTDGGLYIGATPDGVAIELKRFDVQDGLGVRMLRNAGLDVVIVSGRVSEATKLRAAELGVREVFQDAGARKLPILNRLLAEKQMEWTEVALMGDDLADLSPLRKVGLAATVANCVPEVCRVAAWRSSRRGGRGAVREFAEALLRARGEWTGLVDDYCRERGG